MSYNISQHIFLLNLLFKKMQQKYVKTKEEIVWIINIDYLCDQLLSVKFFENGTFVQKCKEAWNSTTKLTLLNNKYKHYCS